MPIEPTAFRAGLRVAAAVAIVVCWGCVAKAQVVTSAEYGFSATVPSGMAVCVGRSGTHVHGVGSVLAGQSCENSDRGASFSLWADYNAAFEEDAVSVLRLRSGCENSGLGVGEWADAISALPTAFCRVDQSDGSVEVLLVAQAGRWPATSDTQTPYINYTAALNSSRERIEKDLAVFKSFLASVRIRPVSSR
jgi:hypothetical protein